MGRFACGIFKHFAKRGFWFFLLPNIVHARLVVEPVETHTPLTQTVETVEKVSRDSRKTSRFGILLVSTESRGAYGAVQSL